MSKKAESNIGTSMCTGVVYDHILYDVLFGNMMELIEAIGLPEKQEDALKRILRKKLEACLADGIYISGKKHQELFKEWQLHRKESEEMGIEPSTI